MKRLILASLALLLAAPAMAQNYYLYAPPGSEFTQHTTSSFPDSNILFDSASGAAAARVQNQQLQNELLRQQIELNRQRLQQR